MQASPRCLECVPNFSEGRDLDIIQALTDSAESVAGAKLLDRTSDPDHNRTVLTIAGQPGSVAEAAFRAIQAASELIELPTHQGVHPRIGASDVVPLVPITGISLTECAALAEELGRRIWTELGVPVFLYEAAASDPSRRPLETLRSRSFAGAPDFGTGRHPTAGAYIVGARPFLIAWNINLDSCDLQAAKEIAKSIRESSGGLPCVKALGLELKSRGRVQVSINLTNFERTPLHQVFDRVRERAAARNIAIAGSELIGLLPQRALDLSAGYDLQWLVGDRIADYVLETRLRAAGLPALNSDKC